MVLPFVKIGFGAAFFNLGIQLSNFSVQPVHAVFVIEVVRYVLVIHVVYVSAYAIIGGRYLAYVDFRKWNSIHSL